MYFPVDLSSYRPISLSRRNFIKIAAGTGAGLIIGIELPFVAPRSAEAAVFAANPFVRVAPDNTVTVLIKHLDMGQASLGSFLFQEMGQEPASVHTTDGSARHYGDGAPRERVSWTGLSSSSP